MTPAIQTPTEKDRPIVPRNVGAHRPELDDFLFAAIGEESNGQSLTVVSALGRLGLDPWIEADRFSSMSKTTAAQLLAPMLGACRQASVRRCPGDCWALGEAAARAAAGRELASGRLFGSPPASFSADEPQPTER